MTKECYMCKYNLPLTSFASRKISEDGLHHTCTDCRKELRAGSKPPKRNRKDLKKEERLVRLNRYEETCVWPGCTDKVYYPKTMLCQRCYAIQYTCNITGLEYQTLLDAQGGVCGLCAGVFTENSRPVVDHNHDCCSGSKSCGACVRGLLHSRCNTIEGCITSLLKLGIEPKNLGVIVDYTRKANDWWRP